MFSEYKFSPAQISEAAAATAKALTATLPGVNPAQFAATTVAGRLRSKPASYLQYGPYWWALKQALRSLGEDFGAGDEPDMRAEYGGGFPVYGALVAAEQFRDYYGGTFLAGTDRFDLDTEGEQSYVLFDSDMEVRRLGAKHPLRVSADLAGSGLPDEPDETVLDGVDASGWDWSKQHGHVTPHPLGHRTRCGGTGPSSTCPVCREELRAAGGEVLDATMTPFAVQFEHEAAVWTANVYAADTASAAVKVKGWEQGGRIVRAIEFGKLAGEPTLDSTEVAAVLFVDHGARSVSEMASTGALARAS